MSKMWPFKVELTIYGAEVTEENKEIVKNVLKILNNTNLKVYLKGLDKRKTKRFCRICLDPTTNYSFFCDNCTNETEKQFIKYIQDNNGKLPPTNSELSKLVFRMFKKSVFGYAQELTNKKGNLIKLNNSVSVKNNGAQ